MEELVIAYESLGHNGSKVSCLEYGNCQDLTHALILMQFRERNLVLPIEKFLFLVSINWLRTGG